MSKDLRIRRRHRGGIIILTICIFILLISAAALVATNTVFNNNESSPINQLKTTNEKSNPPKITGATSRWLFMGDIFFGRYINDWSNASSLGMEYPFQRLNEFQRGKYQAWIANFECPSVQGVQMTSAEMNQNLIFNCEPKYLPNLSKWFSAVSLGNNHSGNQGADGFEQTKRNLSDNSVQSFGSYRLNNDDICNVVTLDVVETLSDTSSQTVTLPFAFCGYDAVFSTPTISNINEITRYAEILPTFVMPHMGVEYQTAPDSLRVQIYHKMIDAGAEMILGNHPHYIQTSEAYKGKLIVYSMGNFIFDQQVGIEKTRSAMIDVNVSIDNPSSVDGWSKIAQDCKGNFSKCYSLVQEKVLQKLHLSYKFDVHGSNDSNRLTKPASSDELQSIKERLLWDSTMTALGQN